MRVIKTQNNSGPRSAAYVGSFNHKGGKDKEQIEALRKGLRGTNRKVVLKGRLGSKDNPHRALYSGRTYYSVRLEHAEYVDVYIHYKNWYEGYGMSTILDN